MIGEQELQDKITIGDAFLQGAIIDPRSIVTKKDNEGLVLETNNSDV